MSHLHIVHDSDAQFTIDPITRAIKNESPKVTVIQHDHNSERFTFSIQTQVEGHDMSACNRVEIHYINIDATDKTKKATGVYEADDLKTSSDDGGKVTFSWLLSRNATQYAGSLNFLIRFACITDGVEEYAWNTAIFQSITVGSGMYNGGEEVIEPYFDVIAQWKNDLFGVGDTQEQRLLTVSAEQQAAIAAKGVAVLDSIPDEYEALQTGVDTLFNSVASGIRGNLSGPVVRADNVSAVNHNVKCLLYGKNLLSFPYSDPSTKVEDGITFTISDDGQTVIANGKATGQAFYCLKDAQAKLKLPAGTYTLSGAPSGGTGDTYYMYLVDENNKSFPDYGSGKTFTLSEETTVRLFIFVNTGAIADNLVFKPMLEKSETATEYAPYIDPTTVAVKRCGKNLAYQNDFAISGTAYSSGSIGGLGYTVLVKDIKITKGESYIISMDKPTEVTTPRYFLYNGNLSALAHTSAYNEIVPNKRGVEKVVSSDAILATGEYEHIAITTGGASTFAAGEVNFEIKKLQLEIGNSATEFEPYKGEEYTPGADGIVPGVTSVSPTMTIMTDTPGVTVECEYIVDTKTYIDNKIAEALKGSEQV